MLYEFKKKIIFFSFVIAIFSSYLFGSGSPTGSTSYYGTHTYNNTASLHTAATSPSIVSPLHTIQITPVTGALDIEVSPSLQIQTGFASWTGGGPYFDASTLGSFTLLSAGTGYINTSPVPNSSPYSWSAPQTVSGLTAGHTYYIYIDSAGTLQATTTDSNSLRENNVVLFEVLRDSTSPTNIQYVVKENNSFRMPVATYEYLNSNVGAVIENMNDGANIVANGTQKIQINGADVLDDSGLLTVIPDSGGVAVTWNQMFTNAVGKWATSTRSDTFTGQWNNSGTVTSLSAGQYAVYTLYVAKDNLNSSAPQYFAVLDTSQYASQVAATAAISAGTVSKATTELEALELAQLGFIIYEQATSSIVSVQIQKATLKSSTSSGGTTNASLIIVDTSGFDGILSAADTNVQAALDTIDDWGKNATNHGVLIGRGVNTPIAAVASISPSGIPLVSQGAGVDPAYTTAVVAGGGTGVTTMTTAYAPVISGTTPTGALQVASTGLSTAGFVLTSNGAAVVPSFQSVASAGALTTLTGDTGGAISPTAGNINLFGSHGINTSGSGSTITTAVNNTLTLGDLSAVATGSPSLTLTTGDLTITSGNINLPTTSAAGADGVVNVNATRFMHSFGTNNSFVGSGAGNFTLTGTASTGIGTNALTLLSSGLNNTAVGASAGSALTTTGNNTAVGANALAAASGADSTAVGYNALLVNTGAQNTAVGSGALDANTTGTPNTAVGYNALGANITGANNTAVGASAGLAVLTGNNTAVGTSALAAASGADCTAVGYNALLVNTAAQNTAVGSGALDANTTGTPNTAVGYNALGAMISGTNNVAIGPNALAVKTSGASNIAIGTNALGAAGASVTNSVAIGSDALRSSTGTGNVAIGVNSMFQTGSGSNNVAVGREALFVNSSGSGNVAIGDSALTTTDASNNVAVGRQALESNFSGTRLVAVGYKALNASTLNDNTAVGYQALLLNTATQNTAVGSGALDANTSGTPNAALGYQALTTNVSGNNLVAVGANALRDSTGNQNTAVGSNAGLVTTGADNVYIGYNAGSAATTGNNNIAIGSGAALSAVGNSNQIVIGNSSNTTAYLFGIPGAIAGSNLVTTTGTATGQLGTIASTADSGIPLIAQGSGVSPVYGTATVPGGGTGVTTMTTAYAPVISGTTPTGALQVASTGLSTAGFVLTSNGASAVPSFQDISAAGAIKTITGDTGGALSGSNITFTGGTTGLSFGGSGTTETLTFAGITANGGTVSLATDATTSTINIGTGAGVKTTTLGSTNTTSATTVQSGSGALNITSTNGAQTHNSGTGVMGISTDATNNTVNIGTGAGVKTTTLGSTNTTSATTVQSGSGALNVTSSSGNIGITTTNGTITVNSGTGTVGISTDATANTINIGTGGGVKTVTLGSTNTTSTTNLKSGSGGVKLNSVAEGALVTSSTSVISTVTGIAGGGQALVSGATGVSPSFGTLGVVGGGTGLTTLTAYAIIAGGTTATGNLQQVTTGTSGQVLKSNGSAALPTWVDGLVQTATVTLTTSNVTSLNTTPIEIIAAPGSGKVIYVINAFIKNNFVTTAFSSASGTIDLIYAGGSANPIITGLGSNAFVTAGAINVMGGLNGGQTNTAYSSLNNTAVQVSNPGAAFTGGGTSTITVAVNYVILTI